METISGSVLGATEKASYFLDGLNVTYWPYVVLDILIVTAILYWSYLLIRETRAIRILYGLLILLLLMGLGRFLNLSLLNWILGYIMTMLVVAIPIVFQPELRNALERLGRARILTDFSSKGIRKNYIDEIVEAAEILSKQKNGALIIIQRKTGLREYTERATEIYASVSSELLLSIFYPKSPLHDGAIIIVGDKIVAASVSLPVSESDSASNLGMRHRAGLGITENSDAVAVIVSEETGSISIAQSGHIEKRVSSERLKNKLTQLLRKI